MNLPFFIATRFLTRQKGAFSSFIIKMAIGATGLSVAVMIVSIAIITGFKSVIREKLYTFLGNVHIELYNPNRPQSLSPNPTTWDAALVNKLKGTPHVTQVAAFAQRPTIVQANGQMEGIFFKGVDKSYKYAAGINFTGSPIDYSDTAYSKQVILSQTTADRLNIKTGDSVMLYFLQSGIAMPRIRKVKVAGLFHIGMDEIDKAYGMCDLRLIQRLNNWKPNEISGYQVDLDKEELADTTSSYIFQNYLQPPLTSYTIKDIFPSVFDWLDLQDVNGRIILIIMAVVAIINLATALMILIIEQAKMVGLIKALGMPFHKIQQIFLYYAAIIASAGILAGNLFAWGLCELQLKTGFLKLSEDSYSMREVPVRLYWWQIATIDMITLVICVLCMWLPTLYLRRIQPAKVLQFK